MLTLMRSTSTRWQTKHSQSTKKEFFGGKGRLKSTKANCSCRKFLEKIFDKEITEGSLFKIQSYFGKFTQFLITNENFTYTSPELIAFSHILKLFLHNDIWKKNISFDISITVSLKFQFLSLFAKRVKVLKFLRLFHLCSIFKCHWLLNNDAWLLLLCNIWKIQTIKTVYFHCYPPEKISVFNFK